MQPVVLVILDGWGFTEERRGNAIASGSTPTFDDLMRRCPHALLRASGGAVGLPDNLMGNSEVGHLTIGAGRVILQKLERINQAIRDGSFADNEVLLDAIGKSRENQSTLHLIGLLSNGGVHSSIEHLWALIELAHRHGVHQLVVHPITDGRDTAPDCCKLFLSELLEHLGARSGVGVVAGRFYAMDRDRRWDRTRRYWQALVMSQGLAAQSVLGAVDASYGRGELDEFIQPTIITGAPIKDGDSVVTFNFRPDRMRQIVAALARSDFSGFAREVCPEIELACLTQYDPAFGLPVAFARDSLGARAVTGTLCEVVSEAGLRQMHIAETEKYAHVTYFLNGGREAPFPGEERVLVPSPQVSTYDLCPEMSTGQLASQTEEAVRSGDFDFVAVNVACSDLVGHTGKMEAAVRAAAAADQFLARVRSVVAAAGGTLVVTADHGNLEQMVDLRSGAPHTAHTSNPVPLVIADYSQRTGRSTLRDGGLADVAPTILRIMGLPTSQDMTGESLLVETA